MEQWDAVIMGNDELLEKYMSGMDQSKSSSTIGFRCAMTMLGEQ